MKILITGASGFIGGAIFKALGLTEHAIYGTTRRKGKSNVSEMNKFKIVDISDIDAIKRIVTEIPACDVIIHAAAETNMENLSNSIIHSNCIGTHNMLWLADQWNTNCFVFLSGTHIIGLPIITPVTEDHPAKPFSTYHSSKLFGENLVSVFAKGRNYLSLRISAPVGISMPRHRFLSTIIRKALANETIELVGHGERKQNYVDIRDIANAVLLCLQGSNSGTYNIAGSCSISNFNLAKRCVEICGSHSEIIFTGHGSPEESVDWDISISKAYNHLGYIPRFSIDDSIIDIIESYNTNLRCL